jgi:exosome complex RNA-binding protein Rrp4
VNNVMRVIAKAGNFEVIQDCNGVVSISYADEKGIHIHDATSAYEAIREIKDPAIRAELLRQWNEDLKRQLHAEKNSKGVEFRA